MHPGEPSLPESLSIVIVIIGSKRRAGIAASCARRSSDMLRCFVHCATVPWYRHHHLRPIEIPKAVFLERVRWTAENGSFVRHPLEGGGGDVRGGYRTRLVWDCERVVEGCCKV